MIQYVRTKHRLHWNYGVNATNTAYIAIQFVRTYHHAHELLVTNVALRITIKPGGVMF